MTDARGSARVIGQLDFRVLGPLEIAGADGSAPLPQGKLRAALAVLLIHANEVVTTDRLIEQVWGEHRPATATKSVHVYISQLRRSLGADAIVTRPPGYELRLEPGQLDLYRFERLRQEAAHAEPATAAAKLHEALGLVARAAVCGLHLRRVRAGDDRSSRRVAPGDVGGAHRGRSQVGTPRGAGARARDARTGASAARADPRRADARALPLGPASRSARGLPERASRARRRARDRARPGPPRTRARHPDSGVRTRLRPGRDARCGCAEGAGCVWR